ncbi:MAG: HAD-IA family hydrolase, partial [Flavobacteriaceae bacterium]|nr:HAD-IA family hydrolase [Flavobacteriaceae bacterium]
EQLKGVSRVKSLEKILDWGNKIISAEEFQTLMDEKNENYLKYVDQLTQADILPGVNKRLQQLKENNHPIALGSASKNAKRILNQMQLTHFFDAIVDGNEVTKAKPDPEVFLKAASLLQVLPENAIVFEDAVAGIQAANQAQMLSVGIGDKSTLKEANFVFADFTEISDQMFNQLMN